MGATDDVVTSGCRGVAGRGHGRSHGQRFGNACAGPSPFS